MIINYYNEIQDQDPLSMDKNNDDDDVDES